MKFRKSFCTTGAPNLDVPNPSLHSADKPGFYNPFSQLQSCYGRGKTLQEQYIVLEKLFEKARQDMERKGGENSVALSHTTRSEYDNTVYGYLRMII